MIEYYLPALLKLCKLAAAVQLLASIWDLLVRNIGPEFYCLYEAYFLSYYLVVVSSARQITGECLKMNLDYFVPHRIKFIIRTHSTVLILQSVV